MKLSVVVCVPIILSMGMATFAVGGATSARAADKVSISWTNATMDQAVHAAVQAAEGKLSILNDSYQADARALSLPTLELPLEAVPGHLAEAYGRQVVKYEDIHLVRHDRWYDLQFAAERARSRSQPPIEPVRVERVTGSGGRSFNVHADRTPLNELMSAFSGVAGQRHRVAPALRVRRVTGRLAAVDAEVMRGAIITLFPDSCWERQGQTWLLVESPTATFIRAVAQEGASRTGAEMRPRAAFFAQVAADLTPADLERLWDTGELAVPWDRFSPASRGLMERWASTFLNIIDRSGGHRDLFVDFSNKSAWGVEFSLGQGLRASSFGKDRTGRRVVF
jgi:hypothetical protein